MKTKVAETPAAGPARDETMPDGRWAFDADVAAAFDDMLRRSIPQHDLMRRSVFDVASRHVQNGRAIVDLGCSRGEALQPFVDKFGAFNRYVGVDVSPPMLDAARARYSGLISCNVVAIRDLDLRVAYPPERACVTLAVLSLQFVPIEHRQRLVREVWKHTEPGGAFVVVEKVLGATAEIDAGLVELYLRHKAEAGYTADQIARKRLALEGVLVPVTARWNEELLRGAGFGAVDCFWRWMNFAAWVAIKE